MENSQQQSTFSALGTIIWLLAALFFLYEFFLRTFLGSVAQQIIPDLKLNAETFSILGSAYYIAYGIMQVPVGILVDKFGVKIIMTFAALICAAATILFTLSHGFTLAFISRFLMGFGSSFAFVCLLIVAITWFPKKYFGFFAGASQFIGTMGPLLAGGPLIAVMAAYHESWRITLGTIGAFGIVLAVLFFFIVKNGPKDSERVLIYLAREEPLRSRLKKLVKNHQAWYVALYSACSYVPIALLGAIWGTEYLQSRGLSQTMAADMVSIAWLGYAIGCPGLGALSDFAKRRKPALVIAGLIGLFSVVVITYFNLGKLHWLYGVLFFLLGIAAAGQNIGFAAISEHVDLSARATGLGLNNGAITLFSAILPPISSYFIYEAAKTHMTQMRPSDFTIGFSIMPILYVLAVVMAIFFIKETYCKPQKEMIILAPGNK